MGAASTDCWTCEKVSMPWPHNPCIRPCRLAADPDGGRPVSERVVRANKKHSLGSPPRFLTLTSQDAAQAMLLQQQRHPTNSTHNWLCSTAWCRLSLYTPCTCKSTRITQCFTNPTHRAVR
eukprot:TRINITY_DN15999_c0_g1_i2.p3 TRINITY_DN15999_c0_g1~~TRINITY_DN15999_c0_g1_i2.p3  ORF type:complete len:121 (-),score=1.88 TRINITY_DN15999_c0_g1_i2:208-570(-)